MVILILKSQYDTFLLAECLSSCIV